MYIILTSIKKSLIFKSGLYDDKNINTAITQAEAPIIEDLVLLKTGNRL